MANKPYRLNNGFDTQGIPLDYQDIMRIQQLITQEQLDDTAVSGNQVAATAILTQSTTIPPVNAQVLTADNSQPNGVKWATPSSGFTSPLTTKGDIHVYSTTDTRLPVGSNGQALEADSSQTTGLKWVTLTNDPSLSMDSWRYGDGADGDLTLGGDTTLTASKYIFRYNNVDLAGHILSGGDEFTLLQIKGTLTLGGGKIQPFHGAVASGATSNQTGGTGAGGNGGGRVGGLYVFARVISGTGSIVADGVNGTPGTQGGTTLENKLFGSGVQSGSNTSILRGTGISSNPSNPAIGAGGQTGGAGGFATQAAINLIDLKNAFVWVNQSDRYLDNTSLWYNYLTQGAGGAAAEAQNVVGPAGGGGGGGAGWQTAGGTGGTGESRGAGTGGGGGGGGGGGSAGAVVVVITDSAPSTLTVSANGGNGGAGGAKGAGVASGNAGGGGGGCGGLAILVAQSGNSATVTATAGAGGASGGGTAGAGGASSAGIAMSLVK